MKIFEKILSTVIVIGILICSLSFPAFAESEAESVGASMKFDCRSAILMEASTGAVLYEMNADEALPPASVTKVMTLLLVMEAIEAGKISLEDTVTASEHACSMGGSQIYLEVGEQMTVEELIKSVVIASANDAALALAEHIAGSEEVFVEMMNRRAAELGLTSTHFENTNGLDDTVQNHVCSARDIAVMSRELIKHKKITEFSSIWMDTIRNGEFGLTNTNRLVRFYKGATGLKTGSTSKAKFCITATAERDGLSLICVIMAAPTRDIRNAAAVSLLDWGFANYGVYRAESGEADPVKVIGGAVSRCRVYYPEFSYVCNKGDISKIKITVDIPEKISAPISRGDKIGRIIYSIDGKEIGGVDILSNDSVDRISFFQVMLKLLSKMAMC